MPRSDGPDDRDISARVAAHIARQPSERGDRHDFLFQSSGQETEPVKVCIALREAIEDLPATATTWKPSDHAPVSAINKSMLLLCGSWPVPDVYTNAGGNGERWVNPKADDAYLYSDVYAECRCGAIMVREEAVHGETLGTADQAHTDSCRKQWRMRAKARLCEHRRAIMLDCYWHAQNGSQMAHRLGLRNRDSVGPVARQLGLDSETRRSEGQHVASNTMGELMARYTPETIGQAYGLSGEGVRDKVKRLTDYSPAEQYRKRRYE